jgi:hypothetical protein
MTSQRRPNEKHDAGHGLRRREQMTHPSIRQAKDYFHRAKHARDRMAVAKTFPQAEAAWREFLVPFNIAFNKLSAGAGVDQAIDSRLRPWRQMRLTDQLLRYLRAARNAEEHGITDITKHSPGRMTITGDFYAKVLRIGPKGVAARGVVPLDPLNAPVKVHVAPPALKLVDIYSKADRTIYKVPEEHRGSTLSDVSPLLVADFGLAFLHDTIEACAAKP